jgi:hypothetical protein
MTKEASPDKAIAKAPERRVTRTPVNSRNVLTITGMDPNYAYRFVNDSGDRVQAFLDNGWEKVPAKEVRVGDKRLGTVGTEGSDAVASVGQGVKAFVLRIRKDWYEEDQAAKQAHVNATEQATREQALDGTYGKLDITRS